MIEMTWNVTSTDLSTQWQDVDAVSTLYDVALAFGIDKLSVDTDIQWISGGDANEISS